MSLTTIYNLCGMNITLSDCNTQILPMRSNCTRDEVVSVVKNFCSRECHLSLKPGLLYKPSIHTLAAVGAADEEVSVSVLAIPRCLNISAVFTSSDLSQNTTLLISKLGEREENLAVCSSHWKWQTEELAVNMAGMARPGTILIKACNTVGCSEERVRVEGVATVTVPTSTSPTPSTTQTDSIPTTAVAVNPNYWMMFVPLLACLVLVVASIVVARCAKDCTVNHTPDQALEPLKARNGA